MTPAQSRAMNIRASAPGPKPSLLQYWLRHGAHTLLWGLLVGVMLSALSGWRNLAVEITYSLCIGLSCWALIDGGRMLIARHLLLRQQARGLPSCDALCHGWPGWGWMSLCVLVGALGGFTIGRLLGDLITGRQSVSLWSVSLSQAGAMLSITALFALAATVFFHTRGRMVAAQMEAEHAQRVAAETQLMLLQAQLEPHMLFNTLANLRVLIGMDAARAQAMLDQLIAFLRATLEASRVGQHALKDEFARLGDYLGLMQVRMGARLQPEFDLPEALAALELPALLLQPLVENAIKHGLEPAIEGGTLRVSAQLDDTNCVLTVQDDGLGQQAGPDTTGTGFGVQQVRDRLQARYGAAARFALSYPSEGGCLIEIRIPAALMRPGAPTQNTPA